MTEELLGRARTGDGQAFAQLTDPYGRELQVHCYRILGSAHDAEDVMQEVLLAAWQGLVGFEGRSSIRAWLYALRSASRRPQMDAPILTSSCPSPPGWAISLAFVTALQLLPPRQRAVLVLRDVLGFRSREAAQILNTTEESVSSALKRARSTLKHRSRGSQEREAPPEPNSPAEQDLVERLTRAYETNDLDGVVALLTRDVWLRMPPVPIEYQGRELATRFFAVTAFRPGRAFRLVPTRATGQPALGVYARDPHGGLFHANGLMVLTLAGSLVCAMTRFDPRVLAPIRSAKNPAGLTCKPRSFR